MSAICIETIGAEVVLVRMNRPQALNALDEAMNGELAEFWPDFDAHPDWRVAVLTGEGRAFCAGADIRSWLPRWESATPCDLRKNVEQGLGGGLTRGWHRLKKPVIAAVNGPAYGAGFELALACDLRIAAESARFGVLEMKLGLHQGDGGMTRLLAIAGLGVAMDLTLSGREIDAHEALDLHLVSQVVADDALIDVAVARAKQIAANNPAAIRSARETLLDLIGRSMDDSLRLEALNGYSSMGNFSVVRERLARRKTN